MLSAIGQRASEASIIGTRAQVLAALHVQDVWRQRHRQCAAAAAASPSDIDEAECELIEVEVVISLEDISDAEAQAPPAPAHTAAPPASLPPHSAAPAPVLAPLPVSPRSEGASPDSSYGAVEKEMVVARSMADVLEVISNFGEYPKWVTGLQKVEVIKRDAATGRGSEVQFTAGAMGLSISYTLANTLACESEGASEATILSWRSIAGGVKSIVGSYHLSAAPESGDDCTRVRYKLDVDTGFKMPALLRRTATGLVIGAALPDLKKHLESGAATARRKSWFE